MTGRSNRQRVGFYNSDGQPKDAAPASAEALEVFAACSIIAAVNTPKELAAALDSPTRVIYLLSGNPLSLPEMIAHAHDRSKVCLVNIDFIRGLARDSCAVEFLAAHKVDGIVSTRIEVLEVAHSLGLITVQRTFAIDSAAVTATIKSLNQFRPDAIEVLPAMAAPKVARRMSSSHPKLPLIGGGLIDGVKEIEDLLAAGVRSVSVSDQRLWLI
jgi:glycerol uptake operon antiterminator